MPAPDFTVPPVRPGAAPTLDVPAVGFRSQRTASPVYVRMTEAVLRWLRFHFGDPTRIEYSNLTDRVWTDTPDSPIVIASLAEWRPTQAQERPAVLVDRLDQEKDMNHRIIGDQIQGLAPGHYVHYMGGQHVCHCLGGREGEAEFLAAEVWRELSRFAPLARAELCLTRFLPVRIGKRVQLGDEHKEVYSIPVTLVYFYEENWTIKPLDEAEVTTLRAIFAG